jgi:hypothetical protein
MAGMFVLGDDGRLIGLNEHSYDSEKLLQDLLATYPDLLAGEEMAPGAPRRWLLVSQETGVPDAADAGARWSVDHLFLDQEGIPTLVEVKRSTDTRIRREVVGQMLDYAANAVVYLPVERIRSAFEARCAADGRSPEEVLGTTFGMDADADAYWADVQTNLQAGRVRLVFVSDAIPTELRRIIEFLNGQMNPAEVYGVEIRQYVGERLRTLVPRLVGRTADAGRAKSGGGSVRGAAWTLERFEAALESQCGPAALARARRIRDWTADRSLRLWWGQGKQHGGFVVIYDAPDGTAHQLFEVWTNGYIELFFKYLANKGPFADEALRRDLMARLNDIPGIEVPEAAVAKRPNVSFDRLPDDGSLERFLVVFDWAIEEIRRAT